MKLALIILSLVFITSCGRVEELEKKTDNMENTMEKMDSTVDHMDSNMTSMYFQVRQSDFEEKRTKQMSILLNSNSGMGQKLAAAEKYFSAFEYQLWTNVGRDTLEYRNQMIAEALEEFYQLMGDIFNGYDVMSPTLLDDANPRTKAFYALATKIHSINIYQENLVAKSKGLKLISLFDVIQAGLQNERQDAPLEIVDEVILRGINQEVTEALINARMNYFLGLALKNMTDKHKMGFWAKAKGLVFRLFSGRIGELEPKTVLNDQNQVTKEYIVEKLEKAVRAKEVLSTNNLTVRIDRSLESISSNLARYKTKDALNQKIYQTLDQLRK
ncbi:MAG: hypothetical protein HON90_16060 [Halobacteriovoraceae bacterium]|jgi:hypothetical protein|nr:hypothetical protein [Halobacteriovoraceae bacterium]